MLQLHESPRISNNVGLRYAVVLYKISDASKMYIDPNITLILH